MNPNEKRRWMEAITLKMKSIGPLAQQAASENTGRDGGMRHRVPLVRRACAEVVAEEKESRNEQMP